MWAVTNNCHTQQWLSQEEYYSAHNICLYVGNEENDNACINYLRAIKVWCNDSHIWYILVMFSISFPSHRIEDICNCFRSTYLISQWWNSNIGDCFRVISLWLWFHKWTQLEYCLKKNIPLLNSKLYYSKNNFFLLNEKFIIMYEA